MLSVLLVIGIIFFILFIYNKGYAIIKLNFSFMRIYSIGSNYKNKVKFICKLSNGSTRRVLRFKEDKVCNFKLDCLISKGNLTVNILDSDKNNILILNKDNKQGSINVKNKCKYYIVIKYKKFTGNCNLTWY